MTDTTIQRWATREDVAAYLQVDIATVDRYRERGMPSTKLGKGRTSLVRFWLPDVDLWIRENEPNGEAA